jgi:hypothetical protein
MLMLDRRLLLGYVRLIYDDDDVARMFVLESYRMNPPNTLLWSILEQLDFWEIHLLMLPFYCPML